MLNASCCFVFQINTKGIYFKPALLRLISLTLINKKNPTKMELQKLSNGHHQEFQPLEDGYVSLSFCKEI